MESIISCPRVYKSNSYYCSCSWNYHINIAGRHIICVWFLVSTVQHPNSRTIRWNTTTQWILRVKLNATGQMLLPEVFGLCFGLEAYHITKSILKRHFMPGTFISIDNNLQRMVWLHNIGIVWSSGLKEVASWRCRVWRRHKNKWTI